MERVLVFFDGGSYELRGKGNAISSIILGCAFFALAFFLWATVPFGGLQGSELLAPLELALGIVWLSRGGELASSTKDAGLQQQHYG